MLQEQYILAPERKLLLMSPETRIVGEGSGAAAGVIPAESPVRLAEQYLSRWRTLVGEIERFRDALRDDLGLQDAVRLSPYVTRLKTEMAGAEALLQQARAFEQQHSGPEALVPGENSDTNDEKEKGEKKLKAQLAASNLMSQEIQWNIVKKCRRVLSVQRYFRLTATPGPRKHQRDGPRDDVLVSVIAENGSEWVRIVYLSERRLLLDMAANGWDFGGDSDGEDGGSDGDGAESAADPEADISVLRIAADLLEASRMYRLEHNYAAPRVRMVFAKIDEGRCRDIDVLLGRIRKLGITVDTANSPFSTSEVPSIKTALPLLMPSALIDLTPVVNIDTSILVALVSDISYQHVQVEGWHHRAHIVEINRENEKPGQLISQVFEALRGRQMVCTREAAKALESMASIIGTPSEKARAAVLTAGCAAAAEERTDEAQPGTEAAAAAAVQGAEITDKLRALSLYPIPDLNFPVRVIDEDWGLDRVQQAVDTGELPSVAARVAPEMTKPTVSVFSYGWASGHMTITSNGSARRQVAHLIQQHRQGEEDVQGPNVYVIGVGRSLYGTRKIRHS